MRVLVVEDSVRLQRLLRAGLTRAGYAVDVVEDGAKALSFAKREHYDVVVLDLMLPVVDGLEVLRKLRAGGGNVPVLILTAKHTVEDRVRGLGLGADDYLQKPFALEELLARVQALVRRKYGNRAPDIRIGDLWIETAARRVSVAGVDVQLTKREYQVLEYLARRRGDVVTRIDIEDHVYGEANLPDSNAVEAAVCTLRRKLRAGDAARDGSIRTIHGVGYVLDR